jgi:hypothetical protein
MRGSTVFFDGYQLFMGGTDSQGVLTYIAVIHKPCRMSEEFYLHIRLSNKCYLK